MSTTLGIETFPDLPAGWTRSELRALIGRYFGYHAGRATGGGKSYLLDSSLGRFADDYWRGACLYITEANGAAPQGEEAIVVDFTASGGRLDLSPPLSDTIQSGDRYELFQRVTASQIHDALNHVATGSTAVYTLNPSSLTVDYPLNGVDGLYNVQQVVAVYYREMGDSSRRPIQITEWEIEDDHGVLTLRLNTTFTSSDSLWIVYQLGPDSLLTDDSKINLPPMLVRARAIVYLLENMLTAQDQVGLEKYGTLLRDMREVAAREAASYHSGAGRARYYQWQRSTPAIPRYYAIFGKLP